MSSQPSVQSPLASELDHEQRADVREYDEELREVGFPTKLRWELVDEYAAMIRARDATTAIDRID